MPGENILHCCCGVCPCTTPTTVDPAGLGLALDVTLTWTGGPATRTWAGLTWTRGETKTICASYQCQRTCTTCTPTVAYDKEIFSVGNPTGGGGGAIHISASGVAPTFNTPQDRVRFWGVTSVSEAYLLVKDSFINQTSHFGVSSRVNISSDNFGTYATNFTVQDGFSEPGHFGGGTTGSVTDTNGITYDWSVNPDCSQSPIC